MRSDSLRIVLTHPTCWPEVRRGAERYVHELAEALVGLGHEVTIFSSAARAGRYRVNGVPLVVVGRGELSRMGSGLARQQLRYAGLGLARNMIKDLDVWHANSLYDGAAASVAGSARPRLRTVFTAHGPVDSTRLRQTPARQALRRVRQVDEIVCVSEPAARQFEEQTSVKPVVIPPGVDTGSFSPEGKRSRRPVLLYVGTLESPRKGLGRLLAAAADVAADLPDLELWLVGQGDPSEVLARVPPRVRVRLLGPLHGEALVEAYRRAWVTALLSTQEVFGMVVIESHACGTPALVLDDGWGPATLVGPQTGVAVRETDVAKGLLAALELAADASTPDACRASAMTYDWRTSIAPRVLSLYGGAG